MPPRVIPAAAADAVRAAAEAIARGELVGLPTETVYGLAADATSGEAVARIFEAKGRPRFNPLICHVADRAMAERHGILDSQARRLAEAFWPGPLTLVVSHREGSPVHPLALAGLDTVGLRMPVGVAREVIAVVGRPLAGPSANRSGRVSPTRAEDVVADLGASVALVVDAGPCRVGVESTIVSLTGPRPLLLRPGGVPRSAIEAVLGEPLMDPAGASILAPGMMRSHYAPRAALRLDADAPRAGEAWLGFGPGDPPASGGDHLNLSPSGDLREAAANLFAFLRVLDASDAAAIAVAPIPAAGLGEAIRDRLTRAAAPRSSN